MPRFWFLTLSRHATQRLLRHLFRWFGPIWITFYDILCHDSLALNWMPWRLSVKLNLIAMTGLTASVTLDWHDGLALKQMPWCRVLASKWKSCQYLEILRYVHSLTPSEHIIWRKCLQTFWWVSYPQQYYCRLSKSRCCRNELFDEALLLIIL